MTPQEKAKYLFEVCRFNLLAFDSGSMLKDLVAKECAVMIVEQIIEELNDIEEVEVKDWRFHYWHEVKHEIEEL